MSLGLPRLLDDALDEVDGRTKLAPAAAIRLVITNLVLGREPLGQQPAQMLGSPEDLGAVALNDEGEFHTPTRR